MKKTKLLILFFVSLLFVNCYNKNFLKRMQEHEEGVHNPTTIEELKDAISKYQSRVDDIMLAQNRIAIWYKILGTRYVDAKMYNEALECFSSALEYYPENHNLFYEIGFCASKLGKNSLPFDVNNEQDGTYYFNIAVKAYTRALELQPNYTKAAYALSIIYVYELNESEKAIPILTQVIENNKKDYDAMFLLAVAYYLNEDFDSAIDIYTVIAENAKDKNQVQNAKRNIEQIEMERLQ